MGRGGKGKKRIPRYPNPEIEPSVVYDGVKWYSTIDAMEYVGLSRPTFFNAISDWNVNHPDEQIVREHLGGNVQRLFIKEDDLKKLIRATPAQ